MNNVKNISVDKIIKFLEENRDSLKVKEGYFGELSISVINNKNKKDTPYLDELVIGINKGYNEDYGDDRICECGHSYYRHFDSYEDMEACGCKYCGCYEFKEDINKKK